MSAEGRMWEWWISYVGDDEDKPDVGMAGQDQGQRGMLMRSPEVERQGRSSVNRRPLIPGRGCRNSSCHKLCVGHPLCPVRLRQDLGRRGFSARRRPQVLVRKRGVPSSSPLTRDVIGVILSGAFAWRTRL